MKRIRIIALMAVMSANPTAAQDEDSGTSMMERGAQEFLEGLLLEMEPAWRELQAFMDAMGPAMIDLMEQVKDWSVYEPPEILGNGDIIIRRKPEKDEKPAPALEPSPQIEL
jgi:hypothetical protein